MMNKMFKFTPLFVAMMLPSMYSMHANAEDGIDIGGAVRVNYSMRMYDEQQKDKGGDLTFETAILNFNGQLGDWGLSSQYRFYQSMDMLKWGYVYYQASPEWQVQFGINLVPFGNQNLISNSFWLGIPYYLGFEDDNDVGVKAVYDNGAWHTDFAFYKNGEYSSKNNKAGTPDIYSGLVNGTEYHNEETNQVNLRQIYTYKADDMTIKVGGSLQVGQIYNSQTEENGDRYAAAVHIDTSYQNWNVQFQAMQYEFNTEGGDDMDPNKLAVAACTWQWEVASKGQIYSFNIAKTIPTSFGSIKFYNDFGVMTPDVDDSTYDNSYQNVTGAAIAAGPLYIMADFIQGKNMTFATKLNDHVGLPETGNGWDQRININLGYYF
jgi:hypothetical protein